MKIKVLLFSALTALSFNLFAADAAPATTVTTDTATTQPTAANDNNDILGIIIVVDKDEVAAGKLALTKTTSADVKQFAKNMQKEHSKNLKDAEKLAKKLDIKNTDSQAAAAIQKQGKDEADKLKSLSGTAFDQEYISAMVKGHSDVLSLLDNSIAKVSNPELLKFLKSTREAVAHHLKMAQDISSKQALAAKQ